MRRRAFVYAGLGVLFFNIVWFIPVSFELIYTGGGPMGFGIIALPFTLVGNLSLLPAYLVLFKKSNKIRDLIFNYLGLAWMIYWGARFNIIQDYWYN